MKKTLLALAAVAALTSSALAGFWQMEGHLPQGAIDDMAVTGIQIAGSTMIAVIGGNSGGSAINSVYYYDVANQLWHDNTWGIPQYPHLVYGLAAVTVNDTIYPNGGYLQDLAAYGDTTYYPIWASGWYPLPGLELQTPRMNHGLVYIEPDLFAVGGTRFGGSVDSTVEKLNLGAHTVSGATPMPQSRTEAVVVKALGADGEEHIYVIGGRTNSGAILNSVIEYDTSGAGGFWNGKTSMPGPGRWMATGAVLNNKIYVMGGTIDLTGTTTRRVDIYDPVNGSWAIGDSLPLSIIRAGAYGVNNVIYFFGGFDKGMSAQTDSVWQYHPLAPNSPPLIRPLNNALINDQSPVFYWGEVDSAEGYRIQVSSDPTFMTIDIADYTSYSSTDTSFGGVSLTPAGDFFWRVKTYDWSVPDSSLWSPVRRLTLDLTPPSTPYPATPSDGSYTNNASVYFSWSTVADARLYRLQVDNTDASFTTPIINDSTITADGASIDMSPWGGNGHYTWRVEARDTAGNWSGYHSYPSFTLDQIAPLLTLTYPFNGNIDIDPNEDIILGFSEPMNQGTFSFSCSPDPDPLAWTYNWTATGDTVYIGHVAFAAGSTITATINIAQDLAGNNFAVNGHANPWSFTTITGLPPRLHVNLCTMATAAYAQGFTAQVYAAKPGAVSGNYGIGSVSIRFYIPGTHTLISSFSLAQIADSLWQATVPGNLSGQVFPRADGLQYRIAALSDEGLLTIYPDTTQAMATQMYHHHPVFINSTDAKDIFMVPAPNDQWRMYSFPANVDNISMYNELSDDLGSYDPTKWRLLTWDSNTSNYIEHGSPNTCQVGNFRAFWLRHRMGSVISLDLEAAVNGGVDTWTSGDDDYPGAMVGIGEGWTDIANPFMYPVTWDSVIYNPALGIQGPYGFDGTSWQLPITVKAQPMMPFKGYSYKLPPGGGGSTLWIMPSRAPGYGKSDNTAVQWPQGWQGQVAVTTTNGSDPQNYFGIGAGMTLGKDAFDYDEPPKGMAGTAGYFLLQGFECAVDLRPELGEGQTWDFAAACQGQTKLTITLPVEFPAGTECYLADLSRQVSVNIKNDQTYNFTPEPGEKVREFKIIAGKADYAKAVLGTSFALPSATLLAQNRPNPLRDNTSISYQLAADGPVKLAVYNVAGQLVKTIVNRPQMAGRYTVSWNGRDESGRQAATGVYFYRLTANGTSAARTMNLIK